MSITEAAVRAALQTVVDPNTGRDFVAGKQLRNLSVEGADVAFDVELGYPAKSQIPALRRQLIDTVRQIPGVGNVSVNVTSKITAHAVQRGVQLLPGVKNIVAVASGKGGVGKSTTAVNLALALAAEGATVGVLDADIYGPSLPMMLGIHGRPESLDGQTMEPMQGHGLQVMSIGFLVDNDQAMIWRGPMATQALEQLLRQTNWRDLDYLVVDMPPGTGDIQLTLSQKVPVTGAVIVTTPQDIALIDARKGLSMFEKVSVPIVGLVENMAVYCCPNCGHVEHIFGAEGGRRMAEELKLNFLGALPLNRSIREQADQGCPTVAAEPEGEIAALYKVVARQVAVKIAEQGKDYSSKFPTIKVSKDT
ncbi:iron-sulfur cluster carrier protein ApbC [Sphaerotilus microaerophilus]|jgi:ATP-binding protein involved in chromosome partitioning|uniref:Iron-sulfur cluster carrier protein n=1 Tax=Sphaerotilus microaerophilus TaxID=2914710 RepID=A0ABN6PRY4_9BURK|nr:iron-sulfur cluster carrier protein ApbC [Sphaerotilus sp. FB-5]BDI06829.1 iron-sulfur cluster carrier protein [Sphaerotilus sp. FB-5]